VVLRRVLTSCWPTKAKAMTFAQWQSKAEARRGKPFPNSNDKVYLLRRAARRARLPDDAEIFGDHEIHPRKAYAMAIGHFADRLRGGALRAALRGRNGCCRRPNGWNYSSFWPSAVSTAHPGRPVRRPDPGSVAQLPGLHRGAGGRIRLLDVLERLRGR